MFREKEICNAIRTAYLYLFPDKKERKRALSRLNMELVAQSVRYRGESVLAYQTAGNHECSLNYYGPELFPQRGILHLPKNYPESFYAGGCFLHPGTMALGGRAVCGCLLREYEIPFGV